MSVPLISVCLPNLNHRRFLEERMDTILAQTMRDWELIVCDSFSDDGSWEFLQKFKSDPRVRLHQVPREGLYAGWNECLRRSNGRYVYMATSDDTAQPGLLESLLTPLEQFPDIRLAYCDFNYINEHGAEIQQSREIPKRQFLGEWASIPAIRDGKTEFLLSACFGVMWFTMSTVLFRRDLLESVGVFRRDRGSQADLEWGLRALLQSDAIFVPGRLTTWRVHRNQASSSQSYDWRFLRTTVACLESVLEDSTSLVPQHWKAIKNWKQHILSICRTECLDCFGLYRWMARREPAKFLANVWHAVRFEPWLLLSQAVRGFAPRKEFEIDKAEAARQLLKRFDATWPPRRM